VFLAAGLAAWTALAGSLRQAHVGDLWDDGLYLVGAQALGAGQGYVLPSRIGPLMRPRYPVGLSAAVGLALRLAPGSPSTARDVAVARALILAAGWVFAGGAFVWLRRLRVSPWPAALIALATAFHPATVRSALGVMTDLPFAAVVSLAACLWARPGAATGSRGLGLGVISGTAIALRGNGVSVLLGSLVDLARRGRGRSRAWAVVGLVVGMGLVLTPARWLTRWGNGDRVAGGYDQEFAAGWASLGAGLHVVAMNAVSMARHFPQVILPQLGTRAALARPALAAVAGGVLLALTVYGAARLARRTARGTGRGGPLWAHAGATLAIFLVWPWEFGLRFGLSLLPLVLLVFGQGVAGASRRLGAGWLRAQRFGALALAMSCAAAVAGAGQMVWVAHRAGGAVGDLAEGRDLDAALAFLVARTEPEAAVASMAPEMVYLYTGRRGVLLVEERDVILDDRPRTYSRLAAQSAAEPDRPLYLMIHQPPPGPSAVGHPVLDAFRTGQGLSAREVYRSPSGVYAVYRIESRAAEGRGPERLDRR
jgi:hypothetical protein